MATKIDSLSTTVFTSQTYQFSVYPCDGVSYIHIQAVCFDRDITVTLQWYNDATGLSLVDNYETFKLLGNSGAAGQELGNISVPIKNSFFSIYLVNDDWGALGATNDFKISTLFFFEDNLNLIHLTNVGAGAKVLKTDKTKVRSVISSDSSITITELTNEIDLTVSALVAPTTITAVNDDVQITNVGPAYTIDIGSAAAGVGVVKITDGIGDNLNGEYAVSIGRGAGQFSQGINTVAVGNVAGNVSQGQYAVAVGVNAGNNTQGQYSVAVGYLAGQTTQSTNSIAIGRQAGNTTQGTNSVAIGATAGITTQSNNSVAVGYGAGNNTQGGDSVAVGTFAGQTTQGAQSVAIGRTAGNANQGTKSIAVGHNAAQTSQGIDAIAIGYNAANTGQLANSIALGSGCAAPGAVGRLGFGSSMEAVQTTATAGIQTLPANPAGFIRLEWNGTLYKIPVYND